MSEEPASQLRASQLARTLAARFAAAGAGTPELDARLLTAFAATGDPTRYVMIAGDPLNDAARSRLDALADRRVAGEPVARILGHREFWSRDFELSPETLVPRPDTETLVAAALDEVDRRGGRNRALRLLDLGTGSGCILVALLCELPGATGIGVDIDPGALAVARRNAEANGVVGRCAFVAGSWAECISGGHDVIVTNPPYIASEQIESLAADVARFDPRRALDGGPDGLDAYRAIVSDTSRLLAPDGVFLAEIGFDQGADVSSMAEAHGLRAHDTVRDIEGRERVVVMSRSGAKRP